MKIRRRRRGVALVAALSLMTLLGLVIVGSIATTTIAERASRASLIDAPLNASAELAAASILADPTAYGLADLQIGIPATLAFPLTSAPGIITSVSTVRMAGGLILVLADARAASDSLSRRRVARLARFPLAELVPRASITSGGPVKFAPDVTVGRDSLTAADCRESAAADSIVTTDSATLYSAEWQRAALDASSAVHVRGDTTISSGGFTGLLLIDGDLSVTGTFTLNGLAVVRGKVIAHAGLVLTGALIAVGGADLAGASITYSPCLIGQVVRRAVRPRLIRGRGWAEVF